MKSSVAARAGPAGGDARRATLVERVLESVAAAAGRTAGDPAVVPQARFDELGVDSLGVMSILVELEEHLGIDLAALGDRVDVPRRVADLIELGMQLLRPEKPAPDEATQA